MFFSFGSVWNFMIAACAGRRIYSYSCLFPFHHSYCCLLCRLLMRAVSDGRRFFFVPWVFVCGCHAANDAHSSIHPVHRRSERGWGMRRSSFAHSSGVCACVCAKRKWEEDDDTVTTPACRRRKEIFFIYAKLLICCFILFFFFIFAFLRLVFGSVSVCI